MIRGVHVRRRRGLLIGLTLASFGLLGRGLQLQVLQGDEWAARAEDQHRQQLELPAPRGVIYDRNGVPLASSREAFRVAVAPRELKDRTAVRHRLQSVLGLSAATARRAVDPARRWVVLPGRYDAAVHERLAGVPGIYFERVLQRFYPHADVAMELIGRVSPSGRALGGVELEFDSLLAGRPGMAVARRNARGEPIPGAMLTVVQPEAGHDLYLTIDYTLQEIAHEALEQAVRETGAAGGDLLLVAPETGEILAAASRRNGSHGQWSGATEPYEPGSILKPFVVAALLAEGRATLEDSVYAEEGRYVQGGRTIADVHEYGWLTLRDALRYSSNIAMAKMADRLERAEQYRYLRDFGFGSPTGVRYPAESAGLLRRPDDWSDYSQASLAIGYEIAVTPLQMAVAYGALANGGVLMEPRLVREVRSRDGRMAERFEPRSVRRVISAEVARAVTATLVEVVERGTGTAAALGGFRVAGKTGTARRVEDGRYGGGYSASFAGFFPADDPQLAFVVKLDRPQGAYYGGIAAAPVTRKLLEAALAARVAPLDQRAVAATLPVPAAPAAERRAGAGAERAGSVLPQETFIFSLDAGPPHRFPAGAEVPERTVPDVRGLALRDAARRLHALGFRVEVVGSGPVRRTEPAPGARTAQGTVVRVEGRDRVMAREGRAQ